MIVKAVDNNRYEAGLLLNNLNDTSEENVYSSLDTVVNPYKVILFDGMALVNTLPKEYYGQLRTCADLVELFIKQLMSKCFGYDEVRLVFDRYISESLKAKTREGRGKCITSTQYRINDNTVIKDIKLKELLSDIRTKSDLTAYLSEKVLNSNRFSNLMVTYHTHTIGNIIIPECLQSHDHEEADTLLLLHLFTIKKDSHVYVFASDTDILLQLINCYECLPPESFFINKTSTIAVKEAHACFGKERSGAIVGFHAFTGTDMTGKFAGRTKETCYKRFVTR